MEKNWQVPTGQDSTAHVLLSVRFVFLVIFLHSGRCYRHVPRLLLLSLDFGSITKYLSRTTDIHGGIEEYLIITFCEFNEIINFLG